MRDNRPTVILVCLTVVLLGAANALPGKHTDERTVIKITARMFEYSPARIELKKGTPVTLQLISVDRLHGFTIPQLGLRADVLPGESVFVDLLPEKEGRYTFLCDIFCGSGHDEMSGIIVVTD